MMEIQNVKVKDITRMENSRVKIGDLSELMRSIKEQGLMHPVSVVDNYHKDKKTRFLIVAGNRRFEAMKKLGFNEIPCVILENVENDKDLMIMNLVENIQRKQTTPWEEGRFMKALIEAYKMTLKEVAVRLGVKESYVSAALNAYSHVPKAHKDKIVYSDRVKVPGKISASGASILTTIKKNLRLNATQTEKLYDHAIEHGYGTTELRNVAIVIRNGHDLKSGMSIVENCTHVRIDVPVSKHDAKRLTDKYKKPLTQILTDIIYGKIKDSFDNPFEAKQK